MAKNKKAEQMKVEIEADEFDVKTLFLATRMAITRYGGGGWSERERAALTRMAGELDRILDGIAMTNALKGQG